MTSRLRTHTKMASVACAIRNMVHWSLLKWLAAWPWGGGASGGTAAAVVVKRTAARTAAIREYGQVMETPAAHGVVWGLSRPTPPRTSLRLPPTLSCQTRALPSALPPPLPP